MSRYYVKKEGECVMRMVNAEFEYTYEYQGNAPKLVHTPLTDKCYLTLTQGSSHVCAVASTYPRYSYQASLESFSPYCSIFVIQFILLFGGNKWPSVSLM